MKQINIIMRDHARHPKRARYQRRLLFAYQVLQDLTMFRAGHEHILSVAYPNGRGTTTREEWANRFNRDVLYRCRIKPIVDGTNAERAMDIMRHGEDSQWFDARDSIHRAGACNRGIVHYLNRFKHQLDRR